MPTHSPTTVTDRQSAELAECARQLQERWPLLFDYLECRDKALERALRRIPSQADLELGSVFNLRTYLAQTLNQLPPGIGRLANEEHTHA